MMSKRTDKTTTTDSEETATSDPKIEERLNEMTAAFLDQIDAVGKEHGRTVRAQWLGITTPDRLGMARVVRTMVDAGLRTPAHAADLVIDPPQTSPPARTRDQVDGRR